jgi:hypothetical protein
LSIACQRTPEEPPPRPRVEAAATTVTTPASSATTSIATEGRCVQAMPEPPPPTPPAAASCPADPDKGGPKLRVMTLALEGGNKLEVELARSGSETMRGLMYRTQMPEDHGMLFRMGERTEHSFWMRNTCIPLDMMFIEDDGLIVGIVENVPVLNEKPRGVACLSSWVLEVNAGWSRRHGVKPGQKVIIPPEARQ